MVDKNQFSYLIKCNIEKYEHHVTIVSSMVEPRYAYTIGLKNIVNYELVFAGGIYYLKEDIFLIFNAFYNEIKKGKDLINETLTIDNLGNFSLSEIDASWSNIMLIGAFDYFKTRQIKSFQILPDKNHYTLDIPDMKKEFTISTEPIWQWITRTWNYSVPQNSIVITNLKTLLGESITEIMRWENDEWEMFAGAGPNVKKNEMRVISLGTIIGIDKTILPAMDLKIGKGLWRDSIQSSWNNWE
ncbi:protein of unknown function [Chitinophaga costaii]|uniref:Uncharacterized protein n=1 Tax=Chitinophaga costaii TaxID=1335309 RepID=A0A1C4G6N6_9BACT|nr:DUF4262 domain-containing protein [Chitinophaga costaii]SCC63806.1 protein of unknown function [Chitinophaga costaii]